jgi:hypothetical protein
MQRAARLAKLINVGGVCLLASTFSCSTTPTGPLGRDIVYPQRHSNPNWSSGNSIAYVDEGITCVQEQGGYFIDTTKVGVWLLDPSTGLRGRILSYGEFPCLDSARTVLAVVNGNAIELHSLIGGPTRIVNASNSPVDLSLSDDGSRVAWDQVFGPPGIWVAGTDSLIPRRVTTRGDSPSWFRHQSRLLSFDLFHDSVPESLQVLDSDSGKDTLFAILPPGSLNPQVSPDRRFVVSERLSATELSLTDRSSRNSVSLTTGVGAYPTWAPDNATVAYVRLNLKTRDSSYNVLWAVNTATRATRMLVAGWPQACP